MLIKPHCVIELEDAPQKPKVELESGHLGASEAEAREIYELPAEAHDTGSLPRSQASGWRG
jgi:hypothetical protein